MFKFFLFLVLFFTGAAPSFPQTNMPNYSMSWNTLLYANGTHLLSAVVSDLAGNLTTSNIISLVINNLTTPCLTGSVEVEKIVGDSITIKWDMISPLPSNLLYYRIRKSQAPAGAFNVWVKIPSDKLEYIFIADKKGTYYYYISGWYSVLDVNGNTVVRESTGSNQIKITIK